MSGHYPPVTHRDFIAFLKSEGFAPEPQKGTSHQNWTRTGPDGFRKVTVDINNDPYHRTMLGNMLNQVGISKKDFYAKLRKL